MLRYLDPRLDDDFDETEENGFGLAFVQNLVGPFARFNGALAVVNPKNTRSLSGDSIWPVEVLDELNFPNIPKCLGLRSENLRFHHTHNHIIAQKDVCRAWVAATLNDTTLCQHQRTARMRFMLGFGMNDSDAPENIRQITQHIVSLIRTEAALDADLLQSCAMCTLLLSYRAGTFYRNEQMTQRLLGAGGLDATILSCTNSTSGSRSPRRFFPSAAKRLSAPLKTL